ncbi:MAG: ISKra4 family transposase [Gammaproteobacteria bacterium]|nr:ISKra4 family transposase [Gammaproteobacteria bacterium]
MEAYAYTSAEENPFEYSTEQFASLTSQLLSKKAGEMRHSDLETLLEREGRELLRRLLQDHLSLRSKHEQEFGLTGSVMSAEGECRHKRGGTRRRLISIFGPVSVERIRYGGRGMDSLHPVDAELNLPAEMYSHGVRRRVAEEAARGSFDETVSALQRTTGAEIAKRQVEEQAVHAATDFDQFYETRVAASRDEAASTGSVVVVSTDGKGIVMRKTDLREKTREAATNENHKLHKRLSKGEKRNCKRMAMVATVYTVPSFERSPEDIVKNLDGVEDAADKQKRPRPENKRVWASVEKPANDVIAEAFTEAKLRDPNGTKHWVGLVDGNKAQLQEFEKQTEKHDVSLTIILDIIHVIEYLWKAATVFCKEGTREIEAWVSKRILRILKGEAHQVAAGIRRSATMRNIGKTKRKAADKCANYLLKYKDYLHYDQYLAKGFPIATGVIEGACRYLINDRLGITGARWGLQGAEAILRLRSLRTSGDFEQYWKFHQEQEYIRNHKERYAAVDPPRIAIPENNNRPVKN